MAENTQSREPRQEPRFFSVPAAARILGVSPMTLYRSIAANEFPAIRIRNRLIIPAEYVNRMEREAIEGRITVNTADWPSDRKLG